MKKSSFGSVKSASSHSKSKYRKYNKKMFGFFYCSILMSIGISISIFGASAVGHTIKLIAAKVYYTSIYFSSVIIIIVLWTYFFVHRKKTYEALLEKGKVSCGIVLSDRGEKVNMYLRFGIAMFGICSLVYSCSATYIRTLDTDSTASSIIHGVGQALFITVQTVFILQYHRLVTLVHGKIMKFALLHLTITNMLMWVHASIGKVSAEFETSNPCKKHKNEIVCKLCVYLLPTVSEYTVIAAAVIHEVYLRIGKVSLIELEKKTEKNKLLCKCPKNVTGLSGGAVLVLACMFSSVSSVVLHILEKGEEWIYLVHSGQMIVLNILGIIFLIITFLKIKTMKFSVTLTKSSLDKNILFVSYILSINFSLIVLIACAWHLNLNFAPTFSKDLTLRLVSSIVEIIQASMQTHLIMECFQRCSYNSNQKSSKPGRNYLALLIGINFGMWFLWSLQIKNADIIYHKSGGKYIFISNSEQSLFLDLKLFFLQSTLPLGMLFRYHSSACLSDIYSKIYQTESERFVDHLRSGKLRNDQNKILSKEKPPKCKGKSKRLLHSVSFNNDNSDNESNTSDDVKCKTRSKSVGLIPMSTLRDVSKKMMRRATIKNMEEAQYKYISEQISHQIIHRNMSHEASVHKRLKDQKHLKKFPNVNRMLQQNLLDIKFECSKKDDDNDSAYSI